MLRKLKPYLNLTFLQGSIILLGWLSEMLITMFRPKMIGLLTDEGLIHQDYTRLCIWLGVLVCVSLIAYGNEIIHANVFARVGRQFARNLHQASFEKMMRIPISYLQKRNPAEVFSTMNVDINQITRLADNSSFRTIVFLFQLAGGLIGLVSLNYVMALAVLAVIPIKQITILKFAKNKNQLSDLYIREWQGFSEWYGAQVDGMQEIKLWNLYFRKTQEFGKQYNQFLHLSYQVAIWDSIERGAEQCLNLLLEVVIYLGCGYWVCSGRMSVGNAIAFLSYASYVSGPYGVIAQIPYIWADIRPSIERFLNFLDIEEEQLEGIEMNTGEETETPAVEFRNVTFGYNEEHTVLENISLKIKRQEKIAIIGDNGEGKSTLIHLLLGLLIPKTGTIFFKENTMDDMGLIRWREHFSLVSQKPYLFPDTIKNNIDLEEQKSIKELEDLLSCYGMRTFIEKFHNGMSYRITGNSANLSGGERQKISFLRAMSKEADIVILDEGFSNCDEETRKLCRRILLDPDLPKTVILISHYEEDIRGVDRIYKLKNHQLFKL
ncbi:MAG: ABC transporter ATP-binding protein [Lachnospiraceae bacterium]|nr:ABC transporter ATP-binding protein [Lachnospiraceae bacterium]